MHQSRHRWGAWTTAVTLGLVSSGCTSSTEDSLWAGGVVGSVQTPVGTVYTVTNTNDKNAGSLRKAILDANGNAGPDTIQFSIPGTGIQTIAVTSALPTITESVQLDATSQTGFAGTPLIRVDGGSTSAGSGIVLGSTSDGSVIRGLIITRFKTDGIQIQSGADDITIAGNWIGTAGTGTVGVGNLDDGIDIRGLRATIGGTGLYDRNVITNGSNEGITIAGSGVTSHVIAGNYIGLDPDGLTGGGNTDVGITILGGSGNTIGGTSAQARNVISKNYEGVELNTSNNIVQGNYIGTDAGGTLNRGNRAGYGVQLQGSSTGTVVGGTAAGTGNLIAFNGLDGVFAVNGSGHAVLGNSIFANVGLGIDLGADGVLDNDTGDADNTGANNGQNFPVLTRVLTTGSVVQVAGTLNSSANSYYRVEFFSSASADSSGHGEGQTYLGATHIATDADGNACFRATLNAAVTSGRFISATATKSINTFATFSDTSEFAASVTAVLVPAN